MIDVIVIGSGIGGLSCAAILAKYGFNVLVCESHSIAGGAAHSFKRNGYTFDSGPSLYSGMSYSPSPNPLRQVLDAIDEDISWLNYETWGCCLPEGTFDTQVGASQFCEVLQQLRGESAVAEWQRLQEVMSPLARAAIALPPAAVRYDLGALLSVGQYLPAMVQNAIGFSKLTGAFAPVMNQVITDPFIRNWLDLLCFLLSGLPADSTNAAEVAFMFADWYRPNVKLDYPAGGSGAIVDALVRGIEKHSGKVRLRAPVEKVLVENQKAIGVRLQNGEELRSRYVVSNASIWDTLKLVDSFPKRFQQARQATPTCESFMHLHLGIDAQGLDSIACHHIVVNDWNLGIGAPQNVVLISIPSILDPSLAPDGKHAIHVYTPGNEPYEVWEQCENYEELKQQRAEVMWKALERVIPDIRSRTELSLVGTPITHERFLRRYRGTYGAAIRATDGLFPSAMTPISGLLCCGDSTFPGIGLPAVAASGMIAANTIAPVGKHLELLRSIR
ncbi:phytoene desaturase family protein [Leptolyngbya sp. NIES-2104]|uniref:phytoene desaturase family protein n=1 Tax=Leptolyngbya sp. NIES-2104 TaxID=1552121 RepID=UPI0006EC4A52|nr:NAD(P)/FAD-dependent oxidoreductase [Leptolyngbya sp. NIES-2104]GAP97529.1 phytoene dehydrogenase and related proteins [Leptolyngbya sp. NIES-2104]